MQTPLFTVRFKLSCGPVTIRAYEKPYTYSPTGHTSLRCELVCSGVRLFDGDGFYVGIPSHQSIDGDAAKECATSLFCLKPGDADADFFEGYSEAQLEWVEAHGEELDMAKLDRWGEP
jgi:hypothetical protein